MKQKIDIIIVGAGLSGLLAATQLQQTGKRVLLLEARGRIGGRVYTITSNEGRAAFDLGPAWFWAHHTQIRGLLSQYGLDYFEQYEHGDNIFEREWGAKPERFAPWQQPPSFRIVGGIGALINTLAARLPSEILHLHQVVQSVTLQDDGLIAVQTMNGTTKMSWHASQLIVTLPPHLAATTITYSPELPGDVVQAMQATPTWMGEAMKVLLVYKRPFWRDKQLSGLAVSYAGPVQQFHDASPQDGVLGALFGWVGNHSSGRTLALAERRAAVIGQAVRLFGKEAGHPLDYAEMNWEDEPFTTNRHDPHRVLVSEHPHYGHPLLQLPQMEGRLWWATTEVSAHEGGYLEGAVSIGRQVAEKVVAE